MWPQQVTEGDGSLGRSLLVLDFDGTVCLGDDAVVSYARELAAHPGAEDVEADLRAFLADPDSDPRLHDADDGYQAVSLLAEAAGIAPDARQAAYQASRDRLDTAALHAPAGLRELLRELDVRRVLCTNAPGQRLNPILDDLGLAEVIDYVLPDARKPALMGMHLAKLLEAAGLSGHPEQLMSVGDIWANDLAPALELGCATAYVDPFGRDRGPAHARAASITDLYDDLRDWARDPFGFVSARPVDPIDSVDAAGADVTAVLGSTSTGPGQP